MSTAPARFSSMLLACVLAAKACPLYGNTTATWNGGVGTWSSPIGWAGHISPNGTSYDVIVDGKPGTTSTVNVITNVSVNSLSVDSGDTVSVNALGSLTVGTLNVSGTVAATAGGNLTIFSTLNFGNAGQLLANGGNISLYGSFQEGVSQQFGFANGGVISMSALDTNGNTLSVSNGTLTVSTLTNATGSIQIGQSGTVKIGSAYNSTYELNSQGSFILSSGGSLVFNNVSLNGKSYTVPTGASFSANILDNSNGTFITAGGGTIGLITNANGLVILQDGAHLSASINNANGSLQLSGSASLSVANGSLTGGSIDVAPGATLAVAPTGYSYCNVGNFTLNSGTITISSGTTYGNNVLAGTIQNNGVINWNGNGSFGNGNVTFAGPGVFNLAASLQGSLATFTNTSTIKGSGGILTQQGGGVATLVINHGIIEATTPASGTSGFAFGGVTAINAADGQMFADANATLSLPASNLTSSGSIVIAPHGSVSFGAGTSPQTSDTVSSIQNNGVILLSAANLTVASITGQGDVQAEYYDNLRVGQIAAASVEVNLSSTMTLQAQAAGSSILSDSIKTLSLQDAPLVLAPAISHSSRIVLQLMNINFEVFNGAIQGSIDISNNDLIVHYGSINQLVSWIELGSSNGTWQGTTGITSSTAAADPTHTATIAAVLNKTNTGYPLFTTFDGQPVTVSDVLVAPAIPGDNNLDGSVDLADFNYLAEGAAGILSGWAGGDYKYAGFISLPNDFAIYLKAYSAQGGSLSALIAAVQDNTLLSDDQKSQLLVQLPEPTSLSFALTIAATLIFRRRPSAYPRRI